MGSARSLHFDGRVIRHGRRFFQIACGCLSGMPAKRYCVKPNEDTADRSAAAKPDGERDGDVWHDGIFVIGIGKVAGASCISCNIAVYWYWFLLLCGAASGSRRQCLDRNGKSRCWMLTERAAAYNRGCTGKGVRQMPFAAGRYRMPEPRCFGICRAGEGPRTAASRPPCCADFAV